MGTLHIVSTPIGNLGDMTYRAVDVLKRVDVIACEDTRVTSILCKHYEIGTKLISYNAHASVLKTREIIELLKEGKDIALVSDAGTPSISDPGVKLIQDVLSSNDDIAIVSVPGASAVISAVSLCGFNGNKFSFKGFVPHKKGRETFFKTFKTTDEIIVVYESPHRVIKTLQSLHEHIPDKQLCVCKELTKIHEQCVRGTPRQVLRYFTDNPTKVRGEFVIVVDT